MNKTWTYNGVDYEMKRAGYGQYTLNGYHCTYSWIWDWCDDESDEEKHEEALKAAERFVERMEY